MKDFLEYEGYQNIIGARSATREAFNKNLIDEGQIWMDMIESRNQTVHTYQEEKLNVEFYQIIILNWLNLKKQCKNI
jgi:nucleotidyltransferase substrate binding protein (TIGR01987 family)